MEDLILRDLVASKNWGPILANLYLENGTAIRLIGTYIDEEKDTSYPGPDYIIAELPDEIKELIKEHPNRYQFTAKWQKFLRELWPVVKDNPWFRYI